MSIKSDRWIRRMVAEHGMIEPFAPYQVRATVSQVISYGTSSYGYDVRCADEFKIFTNINSTIVDPKAFDAKNFVDMRAQVCIIPPNSFALARTIEYLKIPRDVLVVCMGKCLTGETRVADAQSGAYLPMSQAGSLRFTPSLRGERLGLAKIERFLPNGVKPVYQLTTASGLRIQATANHPFLARHGWSALSALNFGDRIAVAGYAPVQGRHVLPHRQAKTLARHTQTHVPQSIFIAHPETLAHYLAMLFTEYGGIAWEPEAVIVFYTRHERLADDVRHLLLRFGIFSHRDARSGLLLIRNHEHVYRFSQKIGFVPSCTLQIQLEEEVIPEVVEAREQRLLDWRRVRTLVTPTGDVRLSTQPVAQYQPCTTPVGVLWDEVLAIEFAGEEPVYDFTLPATHNFVANGLIAHNSTYARCGIIVNVTPLEPGWEGHVTLEFSNTTPLPAKIYANEGVAQLVFMGAEEPCEVSYADRKGLGNHRGLFAGSEMFNASDLLG